MPIPQSNQCRGFTLTELMVGLALGVIVALASGAMLSSNAKLIIQQDNLASAEEDAQVVYKILSEFLLQAEVCTACPQFDIAYPAGVTNPNPAGKLAQKNDAVTVSGVLPAGYKIWPNNISPYSNNAVRFAWDGNSGNMTLAVAPTVAELPAAPVQSLVVVSERTARIANIDVWPLTIGGARQTATNASPDGGFEICVETRTRSPDPSYINPDDKDTLLHYRTARVCGVVFPRNVL